MRADRKEKEKKQGKKITAATVLFIVYAIVLTLFIITVIRLDILPIAYLSVLVAVLAAISLPIFKGLGKKEKLPRSGRVKEDDIKPKKKTKGEIVSSVLAVIMIIILGVGTFYMNGTLDFFNKISGDKFYQTFYVVVENDSEYEKIKDIKGETVGVMSTEDEAYDEAQDKLEKKVKVELAKAGDYRSLATSLVKDEYEAVFLNSTYYEIAMEEVEGFTEETTRVLYEIEVEVEIEDLTKPVAVTEAPFNVYISGIDAKGSISNIARSDVNMIMTVNPTTKKILLTSIPRDYYVPLASNGQMDKLTHTGLYGINETTETVENLFNIDINYYVKVNFTTVTKLVDAIGGIDVYSDYTFSSGGYDYVAGSNHLNGDEALRFARERDSFVDGDIQRVKNQQAVIKGIINKVTSSTAILTSYNSILNSLEDNLQTNMSQKEITSLVKMQLEDMSSWEIEQQNVIGKGKLTPVYSIPHMSVYVMVPNQESVDAAHNKIVEFMAE